MNEEDVLEVEPIVMNGERTVEGGYSAFQKILMFMGAVLVAGMAYKLVKGKTMDAITLPFRFALMLLLLGGFLAFMVLGFVVMALAYLAPFLIGGGLIYLVVKLFLSGAEVLPKPASAPAKLTDEQLTKIYTLTMDDLENGKISDKEFLRVAGKVREYKREE